MNYLILAWIPLSIVLASVVYGVGLFMYANPEVLLFFAGLLFVYWVMWGVIHLLDYYGFW